jgi:hypothetical protein
MEAYSVLKQQYMDKHHPKKAAEDGSKQSAIGV